MNNEERYWQAKIVTLSGVAANIALGVIKIIGGFLYSSHALVADGVHSFSDLIIDSMVLFASKYGSQDADDAHPYGHQRIETASTLFLALLLIVVGTCIIWDSLSDLLYKKLSIPDWLTLPIVVISIITNEALFHYTKYIGKKIRSKLIIANAWHRRSDAASSLVVLIGLLGSLAGFGYLDAIAAIVVGAMIINMGRNYGWESVKELVDTGVSATLAQKIEKLIQAVPGVKKIHQLRSRMMGGDIYIDVHIQVSPTISVSEGHFIAQHVHHALIEHMEHVKDVTVHVDPEDDEISMPSFHLPFRQELNKSLFIPLQEQYPQLQAWNLHYLDGQLAVDLIVDKTVGTPEKLLEQAHQLLDPLASKNTIQIFMRIA